MVTKRIIPNAVTSYRAVIDNAFQDLLDSHKIVIQGDKGPGIKRYTKVKKLVEENIIPETFKDWTQQNGIAAILYSSAHGDAVSVKQAKQIADIVRFMLIYIYELPGRVEAAKEEFSSPTEGDT